MPKLHKDNISIRSVISCVLHPTSSASNLINLIFLQPFVIKSESYIKGSMNLIQICELKTVPKNTKILVGDFDCLYFI